MTKILLLTTKSCFKEYPSYRMRTGAISELSNVLPLDGAPVTELGFKRQEY